MGGGARSGAPPGGISSGGISSARLPAGYDRCNRYTTIIIDEALRRGVAVEVLDPAAGELRLDLDGVVHVVRESLSDLCSAVAWARTEDKLATRRVLQAAGIAVPEGREAAADGDPAGTAADEAFLARVGRVVVKPAVGEGGQGIAVGIATPEDLRAAVADARRVHPRVLLEAVAAGEDLRVLVIAGAVVAVAVRRPPTVEGDGRRTVAELIAALADDRSAALGARVAIPLDASTRAAVAAGGHGLDDVLAAGERLQVRGTANLHSGGTIHDVTGRVHPALEQVARDVTAALDAPLLGVDLMVPDLARPEHVVIEANAQAGLANHEPQPTAERYLRLLFP